jgi:hypothetical protein
MRSYEVSKGTKGLLLSNQHDVKTISGGLFSGDWDTKDFTTTKELMFCGEEMLIDPIRIHNGNSGVTARDTIYELATRGYVVFAIDYTKTQKHLLAIPYSMVGVK